MNIEGKNIVLTGASKGIGFDILKVLMELDCRIVATSRNIENLDIKKENIYLKDFNLKHQEEIDNLFSYALEKLGNIDIFIADAGYGYYEKIKRADWKHIEDIFSLNVIGLVYSAVKMKEIAMSSPYNFVALGSGLSFFSLPGYALYSSTKASIKGFADAYRYELEEKQYFQVAYPMSTKTSFYINANCPSPPKPMQSSEHVAKSIVKGIENDKKEIYPSKSFYLAKSFMRSLFNISILLEKRKFEKSL